MSTVRVVVFVASEGVDQHFTTFKEVAKEEKTTERSKSREYKLVSYVAFVGTK